ncbi:hypothetical protein [Streptomyces sp. CNQ085]|uniref:hypothetical protein n=1 Tax=Streptomyces sp. CNQ085 TaxID=2886944 RepID=UPI001F5055FE|nr:hypothetical protein [Streptomyces sp. CNQ085]MCI0386702.1 hypothetical protein [Streptomyces sp. CNQ085]
MDDNLRDIVLGVLAAGITTSLGWFGRAFLWRRALRREQRFFGLPEHSECLLVVGHKAAAEEGAVSRDDVFALLELSALVKECGANARVLSHENVRQGFGERTEFCVGGPVANRRTAAHLHSLLPGVRIDADVTRAALTAPPEAAPVPPPARPPAPGTWPDRELTRSNSGSRKEFAEPGTDVAEVFPMMLPTTPRAAMAPS